MNTDNDIHPILQQDDDIQTFHKQLEKPRYPRFNDIYDSLATKEAWRYLCDAYATGTVTIAAGSTLIPVVYSLNTLLQFSRWPVGISAYLCLQGITLVPQSIPATVGALTIVYYDASGVAVPLGGCLSSTAFSMNERKLIPVPINATPSGSLQFTLAPSTASSITCNYQLSASFVYLSPSLEPYHEEKANGTRHDA